MTAQEPEAVPLPEFRFRGACDCGWSDVWHEGKGAEGLAWQDIKSHVAKEHGDQFYDAPVRCDSEAKLQA